MFEYWQQGPRLCGQCPRILDAITRTPKDDEEGEMRQWLAYFRDPENWRLENQTFEVRGRGLGAIALLLIFFSGIYAFLAGVFMFLLWLIP